MLMCKERTSRKRATSKTVAGQSISAVVTFYVIAVVVIICTSMISQQNRNDILHGNGGQFEHPYYRAV